MAAVLLALCASLFWGTGDLLAGMASRRGPALWVTMTSQSTGFVAGLLLVLVLGRPWPGWTGLFPALLAGIALAVGSVMYFEALAIGTMSIVAPVVATAAVIPVVVGLLSGERPSALQLLGAAAALAGVVLASREPPPEGQLGEDAPPAITGTVEVGVAEPRRVSSAVPSARAAAEDWKRPSEPRDARWSIVLAVGAAILFGLVILGLAGTAKYDPYWSGFGARISAVVVLGLLVMLRRPQLRLPRRAAATAAAAGLFHVTAATFFSVASTKGFLSLVSILASLSAVVTVALAHLWLHERLDRVQAIGVTLAIAGVLAIVAG